MLCHSSSFDHPPFGKLGQFLCPDAVHFMLRLLGSRSSPALSSTSASFLSFQIQRTAGTVRTCRWTEVGTLSPIYHLSPSRQLSSLMGVSLMHPGLQFEPNLALITNLCIRTMEMNFFLQNLLFSIHAHGEDHSHLMLPLKPHTSWHFCFY